MLQFEEMEKCSTMQLFVQISIARGFTQKMTALPKINIIFPLLLMNIYIFIQFFNTDVIPCIIAPLQLLLLKFTIVLL